MVDSGEISADDTSSSKGSILYIHIYIYIYIYYVFVQKKVPLNLLLHQACST